MRSNQAFLEQAAEQLNLESGPTCAVPDVDIYFSRPYAENVRVFLRDSRQFPGITVVPPVPEAQAQNVPFKISPAMAKASFGNISPAPFRGYFVYGVGYAEVDGEKVLGAHPDCDLWLHAPANATHIEVDYGLLPAAYEREGNKTDGIELVITGETPAGQRREIHRRLLDPVRNAQDRGRQRDRIAYAPRPGEVLRFSHRPNQNPAYDWAYWARIEVK